MGELKIFSDFSLDATSLSNTYIDDYMPANNESQMKIYLYLLRNISAGIPVSVSSIADAFNYSVSDVERALFFMENQGLMRLEETNGSITGLRILPLSKKPNDMVAFPKKAKPTGIKLMNFESEPEIQQLLFVAEQYIGKTLSASDVKSILYIYETLGLNEDVVEYLIEYCVSLKKKSLSYIEDVAKDWVECGVKTVGDAKALTGSCPKEVYDVFNAFGIKAGSRKPSYTEIWFVNKWTETFGFSIDIIKRACEITIDKTHCVSFEYADAILTDWDKKEVETLEDVNRICAAYKKQPQAKTPRAKTVKSGKSRLANQREYDYDELERILLNKK